MEKYNCLLILCLQEWCKKADEFMMQQQQQKRKKKKIKPSSVKKGFFNVYESEDDGTTLATEVTASEQPDARRGFGEDNVCPK